MRPLMIINREFTNLVRHLGKLNDEIEDFDEGNEVIAFVDSTERYDYIAKIEGNGWEWFSDYYDPTYAYVLIKKPLWLIFNMLQPYD